MRVTLYYIYSLGTVLCLVSCLVVVNCDEKSLSVKQIEEEKTQQTTIKVPRCGCLVESIDNI